MTAVLAAAAVSGWWFNHRSVAEQVAAYHFWWEDPYSDDQPGIKKVARSDHLNWSRRCDVHGIVLGCELQKVLNLKETRLMSGMMTYEFDLPFPDAGGPAPAPDQIRKYVAPGVLAATCVNPNVVSDLIGTDLNQDGRRLLCAGDSRSLALAVLGHVECDVHPRLSEPSGNKVWQPSGPRNRLFWANYAHAAGVDEYLVQSDPAESWFVTVDLQSDRVERVELHYFESE